MHFLEFDNLNDFGDDVHVFEIGCYREQISVGIGSLNWTSDLLDNVFLEDFSKLAPLTEYNGFFSFFGSFDFSIKHIDDFSDSFLEESESLLFGFFILCAIGISLRIKLNKAAATFVSQFNEFGGVIFFFALFHRIICRENANYFSNHVHARFTLLIKLCQKYALFRIVLEAACTCLLVGNHSCHSI